MIYFDNAATTRVFPEVVKVMQDAMESSYGNPSAKHMKGMEAENLVKKAQEVIAKTLKAKPKEILFTSGGTESNNTALIGTALANQRKGKHIITTKIEHASVYEPIAWLCEQGFEITYLDVTAEGIIDLEQLKNAIREDTILVSCMMINNEIGAIEPIEEAGKIIKEKNPETIFHVDAIQAYGKMPIIPKNLKIDLLSMSGHKIHGPKGIGFLYIKEGTKIQPIIFGGGQQKGMRSGTENVPGIVGLACACEKMIKNDYENAQRIREVKEYFQERIKEIEDIKDNSGQAPHIASISFKKIRSEVLLHALEDRGIYVSSGSACSSNKKQVVSGTLNAIALADEYKDGTLRFSFSIENTKEEVDETIEVLKELVPMLRKFVRR
ncbi:cysteine desulfurase family protein [Anaerostipes sp. MSJ-23]|uniref:cysteine desulfurase family protein n=1 Tax=Anaerostipes sp. MSJ-23 TaxID=2841520 RepID=UPI001C10674E|nr:cysteine desulfurase family protein [Anaerostipes sp. MSJ-23]MBU5460141.1 cysteine desulfurase [Anaerostipes sp. MSJ-23]